MLLKQVRETGGGYVSAVRRDEPGSLTRSAPDEDQRNAGDSVICR